MSKLSIIVAMDKNGLIGCEGKLPWHIPWDLKYFREKTLGANVVMGRTTYKSIGKALPHRTNIILTSDKNYKTNNCIVVNNIDEVLRYTEKSTADTFVIGGSSIYQQFLPYVDDMYINQIQSVYNGDAYFPQWDKEEWDTVQEQVVETTEDDTVYKIKVKYIKRIRINICTM
ncbi:dihydrofolate reductase [Paenibacillus sp. O199]|uniref:dihydrofolate reductase n=1 Tax=Paenibacillus sp. O199 TaxID=1643925 RepID=UPI0007BF528B|nr:dihydrofolate reductase [Paenibacillus sp. O199]